MTTIQFRQGTAADWTAENPLLEAGEPGYETDTGKEKRGDGVTYWNDLPYLGTDDSGIVYPVRTVQGDTGDVRLTIGSLDGVDLDVQEHDDLGNMIEPGPILGEFLGWDSNGIARNLPINSETLGIDARFEPRDPWSRYRLYGHAVPRGGVVPSDLPNNAWVFDENNPDMPLIGDVYRVNSTATTVLPTYLDQTHYVVTLSVANTALQLPAAPLVGSVIIELDLDQDSVGGRLASFPTNVRWNKVGASSAPQVLETAPGARNRFILKGMSGGWEVLHRISYAGEAADGPVPTWVGAMSGRAGVNGEQGTGPTAVFPAVNANDVWVGLVSVSGGGDPADTSQGQYDWTAIEAAGYVVMDGPITNNDTAPSVRAYLLKKKLNGAEDATTAAFPFASTSGAGTDRGVLAAGIFRGADFDRVASIPNRDTTQDVTFEFPAVTPGANNAMLAAFHVLRTGNVAAPVTPGVTMNATAGWTERVDIFDGSTTNTDVQVRYLGHLATKALSGQSGVEQAASDHTISQAATFAGFMVVIPPVKV